MISNNEIENSGKYFFALNMGLFKVYRTVIIVINMIIRMMVLDGIKPSINACQLSSNKPACKLIFLLAIK